MGFISDLEWIYTVWGTENVSSPAWTVTAQQCRRVASKTDERGTMLEDLSKGRSGRSLLALYRPEMGRANRRERDEVGRNAESGGHALL